MPSPENGVSQHGQKRPAPSRSPDQPQESDTSHPAEKRRAPSSRSPARSQSPPRKRKRPGAAARIPAADREAARKRQLEREHEEREAARAAAARGVHNAVTQHYNAVPERGREWRRTDSKIKGLRSYNNWVKSVLIRKFAPGSGSGGEDEWEGQGQGQEEGLRVLDVGCGKGGDLQKWQSAGQRVELYVGLDPAEVSIQQARERYAQMQRGGRGRGGRMHQQQPLYHAEFIVRDCFGLGFDDVPIIREVGFDGSVGPGGNQRWGGGGWDVVSMMFCLHYAFESQEKARCMLRNVAGSLKKGGRFLGVIPNSDVLSAKVEEHHKKHARGDSNGANGHISDDDEYWDPEKPIEPAPAPPAQIRTEGEEDGEVKDESVEWGNDIYRVKFPSKTPPDGVFRPPFGWRYFYFLEEAVEEVPEYVVPWEAFRALAEDYNLELTYRKPFNQVWEEEGDDAIFGPLSERMNVRGRDRGPLLVSQEEMDAASFYHAFCFYKV